MVSLVLSMEQQLIIAARHGNLQDVQDLLTNGANVNTKSEHGHTALMLASVGGHVDIVVELLQHTEVDVNLQDSDGDTALDAKYGIVTTVTSHSEITT